MSRILGALVLTCVIAGPAFAERPRDLLVPETLPPGTSAAVTSNVIFMNRCAAGCSVRPGNTNSTASPDTSTIVQNAGTLTAFNCGDTVWSQVMSCVEDVFSPFNVVITDVDPGATTHLEVMTAGTPQDLGLSSGYGGVAPFTCQTYQQNALVFDFANVWNCSVEDICSTAAQEIAHTWSLDHSTIAADPMTYYGYNMRRYYQNTAGQCGSDCVGGVSPFNKACSGPAVGNTGAQQHACQCSGAETENSYSTILALFGAGNPTPPTVAITVPEDGANVAPGFPVDSTVTSMYGVKQATLSIDGAVVGTETSMPYIFNAPSTLGNGTHTVLVTGYDIHGVMATSQISVYIGAPCTKPSDCPTTTDTCIGGRCVLGPGQQGGLGMPCTAGTQCASGQCASDGTNMYCVEPCATGQCPSSFGCLPTGTAGSGAGSDNGVCWPNYNDGSGGGCSVGNGGPITFGLLCASLMFVRRRRRS